MKIILPGGSGQVGQILARAFLADGHEVVLLSRGSPTGVGRLVQWDSINPGPWVKELENADAVINLAGRSVNCRYAAKNRKEIIDSRVNSTRAIGRAIQQCDNPPRVWLQSSTATIYSHRYDAPNDDLTGILGGNEPNVPETWRFSIDVATRWEAAANEFDFAMSNPLSPRVANGEDRSRRERITSSGTRKMLMRSAMVMSPDRGGVFDVLLGLVRRGLGGKNGDGKQFVSWIHDRDFIRSVRWLIDLDLEGAVNLCSPNPLPNEEFMRAIREAWGKRFGLPATRWMLELGAFFMQTETELILKSRRVVPTRMLESGFAFEFPDWPTAAKNLCERHAKNVVRRSAS